MTKYSCRLYTPHPRRTEGHLHQIITGYKMLADQRLINLDVEISDSCILSIIEVVVNGSIRIAYDMADGYHFDLDRVQKVIERSNFVFKRSFNENEHSHYDFAKKVRPLGLNYFVTTKNNIMDKTYKNFSERMNWCIKEAMGKNYHQQFYVDRFEHDPKEPINKPRILFMARTWGIDEAPGLEQDEFRHINDTRATCIRMLRKEFGEDFTGGFSTRKEALELYSDCVLDDSATKKENYIRLVRDSDICISTIGLHKSNGWKLAEYVAASKAIVAEKLYYYVPSFYNNQHYLEFNNPLECVEQVRKLYKDKELLMEIKKSNHEYYKNYLRPDKLVLNTLLQLNL
ncbi:hypothetical protein SAMN04487895_101652 [Paenibacillus sophorae]|uniref:Glycosyltransferase family 1 protein n=1 Tax=Paenibacillus sophorae TaxID=1333845 RepID=A0A1H8GWU7_9BACL|nr:hypothetical protein [Paenibacillus sophorae]QWU14349.1 glycosyltransferase family 1 protein [Paenibacillus sophorae]SEN47718.1 hypothetical protein SAMN04487895_101652 [Paenibacillus sophorae]